MSLIGLVLISRIILFFTGYVGTNLFAAYTEPPVYEQQSPGVVPKTAMKLPVRLEDMRTPNLKDFVKFDSFAYLNIAANGYDRYRIDDPHPPANWVFFPLYPMLLSAADHVVSWFGSIDLAILGGILSNLFFLLALFYVYGICKQQQLDERQSRTVILLMLLFPTSLFYSLPYTESLFLLLSAASLYYAADRRYALAFIAAGLSTVTRVPGFVNLFFVVGTVLFTEGIPITRHHVRWVLYSLLALVPMGAYLFYMKWQTGDWLAPFHEQSQWYRATSLPFTSYIHYFKKPYFMAPGGWDNGFLAFVMSTAVFLVYLIYLIFQANRLFRQPKQLLFWVYGALLIVIPFSSQPWYLASVVRYMMVVIPFYIYLVQLTEKRENIRFAYQLLFAAILIITTIGFFNDYYFMA
ncbi:mannosyltransferase family protein [Paenibacillus ginsengarvi]|uniref:Glycosyltransferase RgtA/B/C/D-like domain-containing protein n=1 Tax=Paenibacillus ginsengarvi TaxID=400777 RepID=A0A3B0AXJ5_9BACL|nr:mannosyltransferase family protein [Paenibacillus ginsengarvi]RKN65162.1 hypothetical protein D7M11_32670 [Paenibacillus ginsengarvi]